MKTFLVALLVLVAVSASAQEPRTTETAWPEGARSIADYVSSGVLAAEVIAGEVYQYKHYGWTGVGCSGIVFALTNAELFVLKRLVHEWRPDISDDHSFPSGHTENALSVGPARIFIPFGLIVGYLRGAANKHFSWDVFAGAALGTANRFVIGLIPACSELSP